MSDYGIKISKDGGDVKTVPDSDVLLTSKFFFLKAFLQGNDTVTVTGPGIFSTTIEHNLGYFPAFVHYAIVNPADISDRYFGRASASAVGGDITLDSNVSTSALTLGWEDTSASPGSFAPYPYTIHFYYYIFYDELT